MIKKMLINFSSLILVVSCGGGSSAAIDGITEAVKQGVPQISSAVGSSSVTADSAFAAYSSSDTDLSTVIDTFKLSCHTSDNSVDFCSDIGQTPNDENILSMGRLMGYIEHARMYLENVTWADCEGTTAVTPTWTPTTASEFIISIPSKTTYVGMKDASGATAEAQYSIACGKTADVYHGVVARYDYNDQYDIFQTYYRTSTGSPAVLAFNFASAGSSAGGQRIVLITNMAEHKFIFKSCGNDPSRCMTAYGTAGYDTATSSWVTGYYEVKNGSTPKYYCLKNGTTAEVDSAGTNCATLDTLFAASAGSDNWSSVVSFLGLSTEDQTDLANFATFLKNADDMDASKIPDDVTDLPSAVQ